MTDRHVLLLIAVLLVVNLFAQAWHHGQVKDAVPLSSILGYVQQSGADLKILLIEREQLRLRVQELETKSKGKR